MPSEPGPALPQTCCSSVWLWPGQVLYAGPGLNLDPHSGSVWCLAVGADRPLTVTLGDGHRRNARSVLIPPRVTHHLESHGGRLVSCYLEPTAHHSESIRRSFTRAAGELAFAHADEAALTAVPGDDAGARRWVELAAPAVLREIDPRIEVAAKMIREDPAAAISSRELADAVGLSESRFLHLFGREMGTSVRRYRLWVRLVHAGAAIGAGHNLTTAAVQAGFASPSHLADRFKSTFGLSATQLLGTGLTVRAP